VQVQVLSAEDRVGEVARLLGGEMSGAQAVESQVDYARQLLAAAGAS
jgi:DNA repair ATPase RecN